MLDSVLFDNPYTRVYDQCNFLKACNSGQKIQVEKLVRHMGFMYNTLGSAIKDFVKIVSCRFEKPQEPQPTQPRCQARRASKQMEDRGKSVDNEITQNMKNKESKKALQQNLKKSKVSKKLEEIKQIPRGIKDDSFEWDFLDLQNKEINNKEDPQKTFIENSGNTASQNVNNLQKFQSKFLKVGKLDNLAQNSNNSKTSLFGWSKRTLQKNQQDQQIEIIQGSSTTIDNIFDIKDRTTNKELKEPLDILQQRKENSFIRIQTGRKKKDRQNLQRISCIQCDKYYKVMQITGQNYCQCTSRHRTNRPTTKIRQEFTQQFDLQ